MKKEMKKKELPDVNKIKLAARGALLDAKVNFHEIYGGFYDGDIFTVINDSQLLIESIINRRLVFTERNNLVVILNKCKHYLTTGSRRSVFSILPV